MHLVDHARAHIEETYRRPWAERLLRATLAHVLPDPHLFRLSLLAGRLARPFAPLLAALGLDRLAAMLRLVPARLPAAPAGGRRTFAAVGPRRGRVAILSGCANPVLAPNINQAAIRVLTRHGIEVVAAGEGCCGALVHHLGREHQALAQVRHNVEVWTRELDTEGLDAILITASGCGTTVKDYGFMLRTDPAFADRAARISALARDVTEFLVGLELPTQRRVPALRVAYHAACSLQHGQKITRQPKDLLARAGFALHDVPEGHLCCGSAGTYNMMQPALAERLLARKVANIERTGAQVIATGNIGCMAQIGRATRIPIVHTVELIDWAGGGPEPSALKGIAPEQNEARQFATAT
jgi:glycolate oxidase iron-sulfur subunit